MKAIRIVKHSQKWILILTGIMMLLLSFVLSASSETTDNANNPKPDSAYTVVQDLQHSLLEAMQKGEELDFPERFEFLADVVDRTHDIELIIKTILGATLWYQLEQSQQELIIKTFRQLSIATYAGQFDQYNGEQFELIEQRDLPRDQKLVRSQLLRGDGDTVTFDYVLHQKNGQWRIINILFDGVSDLAIKRSEYRSIMQREGFQPLIDMLNIKIAEAEHNDE